MKIDSAYAVGVIMGAVTTGAADRMGLQWWALAPLAILALIGGSFWARKARELQEWRDDG